LGLTISNQIAERHGWTLDLAPSERGATFRLRLNPPAGD
jgi:signal transduction histidine kinase